MKRKYVLLFALAVFIVVTGCWKEIFLPSPPETKSFEHFYVYVIEEGE
jgi:hypothetical protein